jgi:hypothetical protein
MAFDSTQFGGPKVILPGNRVPLQNDDIRLLKMRADQLTYNPKFPTLADLAPYGINTGGGSSKPGTGVFLGNLRLPGYGQREPAPEPASVIPPVIQNLRNLYSGLSQNLSGISADEARRIAESSSNAIRALQTIDPMAGYRQTAPILATPEAATTSYLNAIGASTAQPTAQQALTNQLLASQGQSQAAFSQALDDYARNYRGTQQADVYTNQARALADLGYATQAQQVGLEMARMQQEQELRKILLEYQLNLAKKAMSAGGAMANPRLMQEALQNAASVLF